MRKHLPLLWLVSMMLCDVPAIAQVEADTCSLHEVVVVGYGVTRKVNLTGAVDQVNVSMLQNRPAPNLSRGLQGVVPNLNIRMYDGNPMRSPEYNIRGMTSIGAGGHALVLIDGMEGDPAKLNPSDVESISVLKDAASAAIYGARGAFGVVLITTKSISKGRVSVTYSGNYSIHRRTVVPSLVTNGYQWATLFNTAHRQWYGQTPTAINTAFPFSQEYLQELGRRNDNPALPKVDINPATGRYVYYDNHDWLKDLYKDTHPAMEHTLSISGGSDKTSYYISGRYYAQDGIYRYNTDDYKTYNLRAKGDIQLTKWLKVHNNFNLSLMEYKEPVYYGGYSFTSEIAMGLSMRAFPISPMLNPDNTLTEMGARSVGDFYYGKNKAHTQYSKINNITGFTASFFDNALIFSGDLAFAIGHSEKTRAYSAVPYSSEPDNIIWLGTSKYFDTQAKTNYLSLNLYAEYSRTFGDHSFKGLVGYNYEDATEHILEVSRDGLLDPDNPGFSLSNGQVYSAADASNDWAVAGGFYRLTYHYKERYLLETNGRVDGSSKFPRSRRFGFFPSVSAGWRISEETFWPLDKRWISQLKVRGSYGALGNGNIAPYLYLENMPVGTLTRLIDGSYPAYTTAAGVVPSTLTWEKATTANIGFDLSALNYRIEFTGDMYQRNTTGMFTKGYTLPEVFGAAVPKGNNADLRTTGWELSVAWNDAVGSKKPLRYGIKFTLADNKTVVTKYNNPMKNLDDFYEGMVIGEIWGYVTEGLFIDQTDIDSHATQAYIKSNEERVTRPGDVKFKNLNGDNEITPGANRVGDSGDRRIIGNAEPRYTYGITLSADWNSFFVSAFFQGVGKRDWYPPAESVYFWGQYNNPYSPVPTHILGNYYDADPNHPNPDAYFPRYTGKLANNAHSSLSEAQTGYLQDVSYVRLKSLTVGYHLPARLIKTFGLQEASVYFTGQNLWTYAGLFKTTRNIDPEMIEAINPDTQATAFGGGNGYPMLMSFTVGINLSF